MNRLGSVEGRLILLTQKRFGLFVDLRHPVSFLFLVSPIITSAMIIVMDNLEKTI